MRHGPSLAGITIALLVLAAVFGAMERFAPAVPGVSIWRRRRQVDFLYWFFTPLVTRTIAAGAAIATALAVGLVARHLTVVQSAVHQQPRLLQLLEMLLLADLSGYWTHRAFHRRPLWPIHAVHHSATDLDWLAAARVHPLNEIITRAAQVVPFVLLGFRAEVLGGLVTILTLYAIFLHANVTWSFGPLRYAIASPAFHRWHHTAEGEGLDRNFAGMFPWIDLLFGTLYLPRGLSPTSFGVAGGGVPGSFAGQLAYPFQVRRRAAQGAAGP